MRPRWLYFWTFSWFAAQGRFTAIFLEERGMTAAEIGMLLSMLVFISYFLFYVLDLLHAYGIDVFDAPGWKFSYFVVVRTLYAITYSPSIAIVTGVALAYLERNGVDKTALGKERLYGVFSWALVNFFLGIAIDVWTTTAMYGFVVVTLIPLLCSIYVYIQPTQPITQLTEDTEPVGGAANAALDIEVEMGIMQEKEGCEGCTLVKPSAPTQSRDHRDATDRSSRNDGGAMRFDNIQDSRGDQRWTLMLADVWSIFCGFFHTTSASLFTTTSIILTIGTSLVSSLAFLYFVNVLGSSAFVCGVSVVITVLFEIPIFQYSQQLLTHVGREYMLVLACVGYVVRAAGYTLVPNSWCVLLLEPLHGLTYGCSATASMDFAAEVATQMSVSPTININPFPIDIRTGRNHSVIHEQDCEEEEGSCALEKARTNSKDATAQALLSSLQTGIGSLLGTGGGGMLLQSYGSQAVYRGAALVVLLALIPFMANIHIGSIYTWCGGLGLRLGLDALSSTHSSHRASTNTKYIHVDDEDSDST